MLNRHRPEPTVTGPDPRTLGRIGIWSMAFKSATPQVLETAADLDALGFRTLWVPGLDGHGALDALGPILDAAPHSTVALGVLSIWAQEPHDLHERIRVLDEQYGARTLVGLGVSSPPSATRAGKDFGTPIDSMSRYLDELDAIEAPLPPQRRLLGALGPRMVDLAARRTAGWHPFLVTPEYTARERSRTGGAPLVAPHLAVVLETDAARARAAARSAVGAFIGFPAYRANLLRLGFAEADVVPGGSDRLIDALVAWGDLDRVAERIGAHLDAGADHVALHVVGSTPRGAASGSAPGTSLDEWREVATLLPRFESGAPPMSSE